MSSSGVRRGIPGTDRRAQETPLHGNLPRMRTVFVFAGDGRGGVEIHGRLTKCSQFLVLRGKAPACAGGLGGCGECGRGVDLRVQ